MIWSGFDTNIMMCHIDADAARLRSYRKHVSPMDYAGAWEDRRRRWSLYVAFAAANCVEPMEKAA